MIGQTLNSTDQWNVRKTITSNEKKLSVLKKRKKKKTFHCKSREINVDNTTNSKVDTSNIGFTKFSVVYLSSNIVHSNLHNLIFHKHVIQFMHLSLKNLNIYGKRMDWVSTYLWPLLYICGRLITKQMKYWHLVWVLQG